MMQDYYQILGISPRATNLEVKRSFRQLALRYHPDKNNTKDSEERFKEINLAYEVLSDPEKRNQYDLSLSNPISHGQSIKTYHRDPAYHRRQGASYSQRQEVKSTTELMAEFLPKFRWACWAGLTLSLLVAVDYSLPYNFYKEDISEINRMYRTGRGGGTIYDHDELITVVGTRIYLYDDDILYFKKSDFVNIQRTALFSKIVTASTADEEYQVRVAAIYAGLMFVPVILLVTSVLGVSIRGNIEFPFNLSIVSFIFLIIVTYLLLK